MYCKKCGASKYHSRLHGYRCPNNCELSEGVEDKYCGNCGEIDDCVCECFICGGDEMFTSVDGHRFPCPNCQEQQ